MTHWIEMGTEKSDEGAEGVVIAPVRIESTTLNEQNIDVEHNQPLLVQRNNS